MRSILKIGKPYIDNCCREGYSRMCAELFIDSKKVYDVWYETINKFASFFSPERCDGLVVNLLLYAMENDLDIECEAIVSSKLYYQLTE